MNTQTQAISNTIIVVDDDESFRTMIKITLEHNGFHVVCAPNSKDIQLLRREYQPILVMMDLIMPDHEGMEGIFSLLDTSEAPIIAMSSNVKYLKLIEHVVALTLIKPLSSEAVLNSVRQVLATHSKSTKT